MSSVSSGNLYVRVGRLNCRVDKKSRVPGTGVVFLALFPLLC